MVAWAAGPRDEALAAQVVRTTRERTAGRAGVQWLSDGWEAYEETINRIYRDPRPAGRRGWAVLVVAPGTGLTQVVKERQRGRLVRTAVRRALGSAVDQPYPVHVERCNGALRDRLNCLTRKTHAFAKTVQTWDAAVGLALFAHNWLQPHIALRLPLEVPCDGRRYCQRTPAMAMGLTDHIWTFHEFLMRPVCQCQ